MSDSNIVPPSGPTAAAASAVLLPEQDQTPIKGVVNAVEAILRQRPRVLSQLRRPGQGRLVMAMLLIGIACSLIYGLVVGTFSGGQQLWAAPIKIAAGRCQSNAPNCLMMASPDSAPGFVARVARFEMPAAQTTSAERPTWAASRPVGCRQSPSPVVHSD